MGSWSRDGWGRSISYAYVIAFQGGHGERYIKVVANCKHYVTYHLENWNGTDRFHFNAIIIDF